MLRHGSGIWREPLLQTGIAAHAPHTPEHSRLKKVSLRRRCGNGLFPEFFYEFRLKDFVHKAALLDKDRLDRPILGTKKDDPVPAHPQTIVAGKSSFQCPDVAPFPD